MAHTDPDLMCLLFVTDRDSNTKFLVDTGADVCVFPKKLVHGPRKSDEYKLFSVTGTPFCTYALSLSACGENFVGLSSMVDGALLSRFSGCRNNLSTLFQFVRTSTKTSRGDSSRTNGSVRFLRSSDT